MQYGSDKPDLRFPDPEVCMSGFSTLTVDYRDTRISLSTWFRNKKRFGAFTKEFTEFDMCERRK
jgi:hypothetical protein